MNHSFKRPAMPPKPTTSGASSNNHQETPKQPASLMKTSRVLNFVKDGENENDLMSQYLEEQPDKNIEPQTSQIQMTEESEIDTEVNTEDIDKLNFLQDKTIFLFGFKESEEQILVDGEFIFN